MDIRVLCQMINLARELGRRALELLRHLRSEKALLQSSSKQLLGC